MEKIFKALGDRTRLETLLLMNQQPQLCLCHLEDFFELSNSNLSRHIKELEQNGLIRFKKQGKWKHYTVTELGTNCIELINKTNLITLSETAKDKIKEISKKVLC